MDTEGIVDMNMSDHLGNMSSNTSLLPGLHDELAVECLIRTSRFCQATNMPLVCRAWRSLIKSGSLHRLRDIAGISEEHLYVRTEAFTEKGQWRAYDPNTAKWRAIAEMPGVPPGVDLVDFASVVIKNNLIVVGGTYMNIRGIKFDRHNGLLGATREVRTYDAISNKWKFLTPMHRARCNFSCSVLPDGKIYVAGGYAKQDMDDAECYDPESDMWQQLPSMTTTHWRSITAVFGGCFYVIGGRIGGTARFCRNDEKVKADIWDPEKRVWFAQEFWLEREVCLRQVVSHGGLLVGADLQEQKLCTLEANESGSYHLDAVGLIPAPEGMIRLNFRLVSFVGQVWVVGGTYTSLPYKESTPYSVGVDLLYSSHFQDALTADCCVIEGLTDESSIVDLSSELQKVKKTIDMEGHAGRVTGCAVVAI